MNDNYRHYTCAACKLYFRSDREEGDALKEKEELFGDIPIEDTVIVCDDCFNKVMGCSK